MEERFLLEANYFGEPNTGQELYIEVLFHSSLEFEHPSQTTATDNGDPALLLIALFGNWHAVQCLPTIAVQAQIVRGRGKPRANQVTLEFSGKLPDNS
jgi:hypothetical protein